MSKENDSTHGIAVASLMATFNDELYFPLTPAVSFLFYNFSLSPLKFLNKMKE